MYFSRFLQWKWLERWVVTADYTLGKANMQAALFFLIKKEKKNSNRVHAEYSLFRLVSAESKQLPSLFVYNTIKEICSKKRH